MPSSPESQPKEETFTIGGEEVTAEEVWDTVKDQKAEEVKIAGITMPKNALQDYLGLERDDQETPEEPPVEEEITFIGSQGTTDDTFEKKVRTTPRNEQEGKTATPAKRSRKPQSGDWKVEAEEVKAKVDAKPKPKPRPTPASKPQSRPKPKTQKSQAEHEADLLLAPELTEDRAHTMLMRVYAQEELKEKLEGFEEKQRGGDDSENTRRNIAHYREKVRTNGESINRMHKFQVIDEKGEPSRTFRKLVGREPELFGKAVTRLAGNEGNLVRSERAQELNKELGLPIIPEREFAHDITGDTARRMLLRVYAQEKYREKLRALEKKQREGDNSAATKQRIDHLQERIGDNGEDINRIFKVEVIDKNGGPSEDFKELVKREKNMFRRGAARVAKNEGDWACSKEIQELNKELGLPVRRAIETLSPAQRVIYENEVIRLQQLMDAYNNSPEGSELASTTGKSLKKAAENIQNTYNVTSAIAFGTDGKIKLSKRLRSFTEDDKKKKEKPSQNPTPPHQSENPQEDIKTRVKKYKKEHPELKTIAGAVAEDTIWKELKKAKTLTERGFEVTATLLTQFDKARAQLGSHRAEIKKVHKERGTPSDELLEKKKQAEKDLREVNEKLKKLIGIDFSEGDITKQTIVGREWRELHELELAEAKERKEKKAAIPESSEIILTPENYEELAITVKMLAGTMQEGKKVSPSLEEKLREFQRVTGVQLYESNSKEISPEGKNWLKKHKEELDEASKRVQKNAKTAPAAAAAPVAPVTTIASEPAERVYTEKEYHEISKVLNKIDIDRKRLESLLSRFQAVETSNASETEKAQELNKVAEQRKIVENQEQILLELTGLKKIFIENTLEYNNTFLEWLNNNYTQLEAAANYTPKKIEKPQSREKMYFDTTDLIMRIERHRAVIDVLREVQQDEDSNEVREKLEEKIQVHRDMIGDYGNRLSESLPGREIFIGYTTEFSEDLYDWMKDNNEQVEKAKKMLDEGENPKSTEQKRLELFEDRTIINKLKSYRTMVKRRLEEGDNPNNILAGIKLLMEEFTDPVVKDEAFTFVTSGFDLA